MRTVRKRSAVKAGLVMTMGVTVSLPLAPAQATEHGKLPGWDVAAAVPGVSDPVAADGCPIESPDGKSLFIASMRGPGGDNDIWVATRSNRHADFGAPTMLPAPVNSDAQDFCPTPLPGGALLFVSTRGGTDAYGTAACGLGDIYITHRNRKTGTWAEPRNLGCAPNGPNLAGMEYGPSLVRTKAGTFLYFSSGGAMGAGTQDIYVSKLGSGSRFPAPTAVTELNVAGYDDVMPNVSRDGEEIVFASSRPGGFGATDIYTSTRKHVRGTWATPANVGDGVNTVAGESRPSMSSDGKRLYFGRNGDIYVSQRAAKHPR